MENHITTILIPSRMEEVQPALEILSTLFEERGYEGFKYGRFIEATYEALINAVIHGGRGEQNKEISITYSEDAEKFWVRIKDEGEGFDVSFIPDPCLPQNINKSHGRGLFIIRNFVDELSFNEKGNEIIMSIRKGQGASSAR